MDFTKENSTRLPFPQLPLPPPPPPLQNPNSLFPFYKKSHLAHTTYNHLYWFTGLATVLTYSIVYIVPRDCLA